MACAKTELLYAFLRTKHIKLPKANIKYQSALGRDLTLTPPQHLYV